MSEQLLAASVSKSITLDGREPLCQNSGMTLVTLGWWAPHADLRGGTSLRRLVTALMAATLLLSTLVGRSGFLYCSMANAAVDRCCCHEDGSDAKRAGIEPRCCDWEMAAALDEGVVPSVPVILGPNWVDVGIDAYLPLVPPRPIAESDALHRPPIPRRRIVRTQVFLL